MKKLKIGNFISKLPIIQGGMGVGISLSGLSSAIANQGGIGVISAAAIGINEPDFTTAYLEANNRGLRKEIKKARTLTKGILGVNIMVASSNLPDMARTAIEEGIDIIFCGAGLPLNLPKYLEGNTHTKLVPIVSSARAAGIIVKKWWSNYKYIPDAIVVEGPKAGGHLGFKLEQIDDENYSLEKIVAEVINELKPFEEKFKQSIPVIAAGGIYTGEDINRFLKLGASGVQMGTRFVTSNECDASIEFKNTYINCSEKDIIIIKSPVGMPGRAIKNQFLADVNNGEKKPYKCPYQCILTCEYNASPYCIAYALVNAQKGNLKDGFAFAGKNAYRAKEIISIKEIFDSIKNEYNDAVVFEIKTNEKKKNLFNQLQTI